MTDHLPARLIEAAVGQLLVPKKASKGWGLQWLTRKPDPEEVELDEKERALLRENAAGIP